MTVLVLNIIYGLLSAQAAITAAEFHLVEGFGRVIALSVACAHLISVLVLFAAPSRSVPVLPVHGVTGSKSLKAILLEVGVFHLGARGVVVVRAYLLEDHACRLSEKGAVVAVSEVGLRGKIGRLVTLTHDGVDVVLGVVSWVWEVFRLYSETTAPGFTGDIGLRDEFGIEAC